MPSVPSVEELANLVLEVLGARYTLKPLEVPGHIGDGTTSARVLVTGSDDRVYFRPTPYDKELWEVIHREASVPLWHGFPCYVRWEPAEQEWIVARPDWNGLARQEEMALRYVAAHAEQHEINEDSVPDDPVWVYRRAIVALRGGPAEDATFRLEIKKGHLPWKSPSWFNGDFGPDLTTYVPTTSGFERWVTHYIDETGTVQILTESGSHDPEYRGLHDPPSVPVGSVPIAYCILTEGDSELTELDSIWDARIIAGPVTAGEGTKIKEQLALMEAQFDLALSRHIVEG